MIILFGCGFFLNGCLTILAIWGFCDSKDSAYIVRGRKVGNAEKNAIRKMVYYALATVAFFVFAVCFVIFFIMELKAKQLDPKEITDDYIATGVTESELREVEMEETIWERIINDDLLYYVYQEIDDVGELEDNYFIVVSEYNAGSKEMQNDLGDEIDTLISYGLLQEPTMTLGEIEQMVREKGPENVDVDVYIQEVVLLIRKNDKQPSDENVYQIARASKDVLSMLKHSTECSYYKVLLFGGLSVEYFIRSLSLTDNIPKSKTFINYYIGIEFTMLYDIISNMQGLREEVKEKYLEHFLLAAESFFKYSLKKMEENESIEDINYYLAYVTKFQVTQFKAENKISECVGYARAYLEETPEPKPDYENTCQDIIISFGDHDFP